MKGYFLLLILIGCISNIQNATCKSISDYGLFRELEEYISNDSLDWLGDHDKQARIFNGIINRLGGNAAAELKDYVKGNVERCYWCGTFLIEPSYRQGNKLMPELAIEIYEIGLAIKLDKDDYWSVSTQLSLHVLAAVAHKMYGNPNRAKELKAELLKFIEKNDEYGGFYPAMSEEEFKIWDEL